MSRKLNNPSRAREKAQVQPLQQQGVQSQPQLALLWVGRRAENFGHLFPDLPAHIKKGRMEPTEGPNSVFTVQGRNTGLGFSAVKYLPSGVLPKLFPAAGLDCFLQPQSSAPPLAHLSSHTTCQRVFKHPHRASCLRFYPKYTLLPPTQRKLILFV